MPKTPNQNIGKSHDKYFALLITALFGGVLYYAFDFRVDSGGDNAGYILRAYKLVNNGVFPSYQGPLYPLILSPFVWLFGVNITLLKVLSGIAMLAAHYIFFLALYRRFSIVAILGTLAILVCTTDFVLYGSETYSEGFFILFQSCFLYLAFHKLIESSNSSVLFNRDIILTNTIVAISCLVLGLTRSIGFSSVLAVGMFLLIKKRYYQLAMFSSCFLIVILLYAITLMLFFDVEYGQVSSQPAQFLLKNPYNPLNGTEDLGGFILRFWENSIFYFGEAIPAFMGLDSVNGPVRIILALSIWSLLIWYGLYAWRSKNNAAIFISLYCFLTFVIEFFLLHSFWEQMRLVVPYYPILLIIFLHTVFLVSSPFLRKSGWVTWSLAGTIVALILFSSFIKSYPTYKRNYKIGAFHKRGMTYVGYGEARANYFKMSEYVGKNIPPNLAVLARKPELSFLFGNRVFEGLYRFPYSSLSEFRGNSVLILKSKDYLKLVKLLKMEVLQDRLTGFFYADDKVGASNFYEKNIGYAILEFEQAEIDKLRPFFNENGFNYDDSLTRHLEVLRLVSYINCKKLINQLTISKVKYLISDNFDQPEDTQSLVDRIALYINLKYPSLINEIHSIGDEYTVELYEVDYLKLLQYKGIVEK